MLLEENDVIERMESPLNLLNRLKTAVNPHKPTPIPALPPSSDEIITNLEEKINNGSIKSKALGLMSSALDELKGKLPEVHRPEKLAAIAASMSKIIADVDVKSPNEIKAAQIIIYAPQIASEETFNTVVLDN